jgi:Domain of unknown function (DUF5667)
MAILKVLEREHSANGTYPHGEEGIMKTGSGMLLGLVVLGLLCGITAAAENATGTQGMQFVGDIAAYNGSIDAGSPLYGLKIAFENLDDSFTFNQSERLAKDAGQADLRLAELKSALAENSTGAADRALDQYGQNLNQTERTLAGFTRNGSGTAPGDPDLVNAQNLLARHQTVLEDLLATHAGNPGLEWAYNTSGQLEQKLEQKLEQMTRTRFERVQDAGNRTWLRAEPLGPALQEMVQNRTLTADQEARPGFPANRMVPEIANQSRGQNGQTGNAGQLPSGTNQSRQDQHRQVLFENGTGTGAGPGNSYRNGMGDTRSRTR